MLHNFLNYFLICMQSLIYVHRLIRWDLSVHEVNAYYLITQNRMLFPAGLLQRPYYTKDVPNYVNYGSIGTTIAHEMLHGFDNYGSRYDINGEMRNWWTEESEVQFQNRTACTADFFGQLTLSTGDKVNGMNTLGENLADINGIKQAYKAYQQNHNEEKLLPGLGLNSNQVFFLAYAQNWCDKISSEKLARLARSSPHAPPEIRVRGSLSQIPEFAHAYKCPKNAPMTADLICNVW